MEDICEALKTALVTYLNDYLDDITTQDIPLPHLDDSGVVVGYMDLDAVNKAQCVFILPDVQTVEETAIAQQTLATVADVYLFVRKKSDAVLYKQAMRYAAAIKKMFIDDYSIHGSVGMCSVNEVEYFPDVEGHPQCKAVRVSVTIYTELEA